MSDRIVKFVVSSEVVPEERIERIEFLPTNHSTDRHPEAYKRIYASTRRLINIIGDAKSEWMIKIAKRKTRIRTRSRSKPKKRKPASSADNKRKLISARESSSSVGVALFMEMITERGMCASAPLIPSSELRRN